MTENTIVKEGLRSSDFSTVPTFDFEMNYIYLGENTDKLIKDICLEVMKAVEDFQQNKCGRKKINLLESLFIRRKLITCRTRQKNHSEAEYTVEDR